MCDLGGLGKGCVTGVSEERGGGVTRVGEESV